MRTVTRLVSQPETLAQDLLTRVPKTGGFQIPTDLPYVGFNLITQLTAAQKLAVGNTLQVSVYNLSGDAFIAGINWTSYGPGGLTITDPGGGPNIVNPDPTIGIALNGVQGATIYITYVAHGLPSCTVVVDGLS